MQKPLYERFRPTSWAEVLGQPKAIASLDCIRRVNGSLASNVYWIAGAAGTGKTTIARLIAAEVAADAPWLITELDGADVALDTVRGWEDACRVRPLGRNGSAGQYVYIVNEAHRLASRVVSRLLTALERPEVQANSTWVFTTTTAGESALFDGALDAKPFLSRCVDIPLTNQGLAKVFAPVLRQIAGSLGLDGKPETAYVRLIQDCNNNMRQALQKVASGAMVA